MIAKTANWSVSDYTIKTMLLATREIKGEHMGYNISLPVYRLARDISGQNLGYVPKFW